MDDSQAAGDGAPQRRVLIVDDEVNVCALLGEFFSLKGYAVRMVCRGEEALVLAEVFHPDVVLLDLLMPGMNGIDTLKELKQLRPAPKVLMLSSADLEEVAKGALELGADFFVSKPADLAKLEILVNGVCPPAQH